MRQALDLPRRGVVQRADRAALDLRRELEQHVDLARVPAALGAAVDHAHHPGRAFATGRALTVGLLFVEL